MDPDWLILVARAVMLVGAAAVLIGLIAMVRPIAAIGLGRRKRAALAALAGLCLAVGGNALLSHACDPTIPCNRCSANRLPPLVTPAHACVRPVTAGDSRPDTPC
jgi:hypothetical protein